MENELFRDTGILYIPAVATTRASTDGYSGSNCNGGCELTSLELEVTEQLVLLSEGGGSLNTRSISFNESDKGKDNVEDEDDYPAEIELKNLMKGSVEVEHQYCPTSSSSTKRSSMMISTPPLCSSTASSYNVAKRMIGEIFGVNSDDSDHGDVGCDGIHDTAAARPVTAGKKKKKHKYRSVTEIYKVTNPIQGFAFESNDLITRGD